MLIKEINERKNECEKGSLCIYVLPDSRSPKPDCMVKMMNVDRITHNASTASWPGLPPNGLSAIL